MTDASPAPASWPARAADGVVWLYQRTLSPALAAAFPTCGCRFHPTCSHYARTALREHGFLAYDLLAPADPFKRVIATGAVAVCDYALPLSLQGQVAARAFRFAPQAKSLLGKLPAPLRRAAKSILRLH